MSQTRTRRGARVASGTRTRSGGAHDRPLARVSGWAIHVPGRDALSVAPAVAHLLLGRKGLLYKEPATRLALCAAHRALGLPPLAPRTLGPPDPGMAVVVSSNLGNVDTVVTIARTVRRASVREVSPLAAPNASSNVIASTLAIWFRCGGPNLTVCSGATGGLDAVRLATLLLAAGRARRVLVVGVEPDDPVASALHAARGGQAARTGLRAAAAAVLLDAFDGDAGTAVSIGRVGAHRRAPLVDGHAGPLFAPGALAADAIDLESELGALYGALGVVQVAAAADMVSDIPDVTATLVCGDARDGWRSLAVGAAPR